jgi:HD-GYP domain-containing protein (c-di-GMP phosphodiesterase class II)
MEKYLSHLRARLKGKVDLVATEDILASKEGVVARTGDIINKEHYRNLSRLNLNKPLENSLKVAKLLNRHDIYKSIYLIVDEDPSFSQIDQCFGKGSVLEECCATLKPYPYLLEIITIFEVEAESLYKQSLLSAYLAYITGIINKYSQKKIEAAFLAGLFHDIGLLFMPKSCLDKQRQLSADEWQSMQRHPIVAFKLLQEIEGFPITARKAVLEHHERPDGSGYPLVKKDHDISELGSLISLIDDVIVIHDKRFRPLKRSLQNILPILQMNTFGYHSSAISALTQAIKQAPVPKVEAIKKDVVKILIDYTYQQQLFINKIMDVIKQVNDLIGFAHKNNAVGTIQNDGAKINSVIASAGLQESSYVELLQRLNKEDHTTLHLEVEQTRLMLEEVIYQLRGYHKASDVYSSNNNNDFADALKIFVTVFNSTERPAIPEALIQYWQQLSEK